LYNDLEKSYLFGFTVVICMALAGAIIVSFLPKSGLQSIKETEV
jgi:hypothetical protein